MINYYPFLCWSNMLETCWPSLESFKTKWERILAWGESTALINHCFAFSKHVSCFKVSHPKISIAWGPDILWSVVIWVIFLWFNIWNNDAIGWMLMKLVRWDCCNRIKRRWCSWWRIRRIRSRPVQLFSIYPFDTFISWESEGNSLCPCNHGSNIDKNTAVNCLTSKVNIFVSLNKEVSHFDL